MIRRLLPLFVLCVIAFAGAQTEPVAPAVRFEPVDVIVDAGNVPLGAYQFELAVEKGEAVIVGLEGGEHAAFKEPPFYDPAALAQSRIVVAAFSTDKVLPAGATRVARLHMQVTGSADYAVKLVVATDAKGEAVKAAIRTEKPKLETK